MSNTVNSRGTMMAGDGATAMRHLYLTVAEMVTSKLPEDLAGTIGRQFHPLFTWAVVMPFQLFYLIYLMHDGLLASSESSFLQTATMHFHIFVIMVGGAMLRCLIGFLISGQLVEDGTTYDYPNESSSRSSHYETATHKSRK